MTLSIVDAMGKISPSLDEAAALGVILIVLGAACLFIINRMAGSKMGGVFG